MIEIARAGTASRCASASTGAASTRSCSRELMDENARAPSRWTPRRDARGADRPRRWSRAPEAEELGLAARPHRPLVQGERRAGPDRGLPRAGARCDYPLHLGLTEAGMGSKGIVASTAAMAVLLQEGIGDTIRVSLTPEPGGDRTQEVIVAQEILQTLGLRSFTPMVMACPGCGRTTSTSSRSWPTDPDATCARRCRSGARVPRRRGDEGRGDGLRRERPGREQARRTSASACPARARRRWRRFYIDGEKTVTLKGERIAEEFQRSSKTTSTPLWPRRRGAARPPGPRPVRRGRRERPAST